MTLNPQSPSENGRDIELCICPVESLPSSVTFLNSEEDIQSFFSGKMEGPDQILPATSLTMTNPEGAVKFRNEETLRELPPMSVPTMLKLSANKGGNLTDTILLEFWLENRLSWLEIPYTKKMFKNG